MNITEIQKMQFGNNSVEVRTAGLGGVRNEYGVVSSRSSGLIVSQPQPAAAHADAVRACSAR